VGGENHRNLGGLEGWPQGASIESLCACGPLLPWYSSLIDSPFPGEIEHRE